MDDVSIALIRVLGVVLLLVLLLAARRSAEVRNSLGKSFSLIVMAVGIVAILYRYVLAVFIIPSASMIPTLQIGDRIIVNKLVYRFHPPHFYDIIVFTAPPSADGGKGDDFVKRVIGTPGDVITIHDGKVYRNGRELCEPFVHRPIRGFLRTTKVPSGHLFVLGDNRNNSYDSRVWGFLDTRLVIGEVTVIISPFSRLGYVY